MTKYIYQTIWYCRSCAQTQGSLWKHNTFLKLFLASDALNFVAMDLLGLFLQSFSVNTPILVITERQYKLESTIFLPSTTSLKVANAFQSYWMCPYGIPDYFLLDHGPQFVAAFFNLVCAALGTTHMMTTSYHTQTSGQA